MLDKIIDVLVDVSIFIFLAGVAGISGMLVRNGYIVVPVLILAIVLIVAILIFGEH